MPRKPLLAHPRRLAFLAGFLVLTAAGAATGRSPAPPGDEEAMVAALRAELGQILGSARGSWRGSRWGVLAVSLDRGDTLFAADAREPLTPASNLKLVTTAAALETLGSEYRFRTYLLADGELTGGTVRGDLVLYGTGDPGLSDRFRPTGTSVFEGFADSLLALGVRRIEGDVVGDGSYFSGPAVAEGWNPVDLNEPFSAPSSALSFNENLFALGVIGGGAPGERPEIRTRPLVTGERIVNDARIGGRDGLAILRPGPSEPYRLQGSMAVGGREVWRELAVSDPARFAAATLADVLAARGIEVTGQVRVAGDAEGSIVTGSRIWAPGHPARPAPRVVATHASPPLSEYLAVVNKLSHNLFAEHLFKTVGRIALGEGSFAGGSRAVSAFLARATDADAVATIMDGSGLSTLNRVRSTDLVAVLAYVAREGDWETLWASLPEAGNARELGRMYRTAAAGNLRAKTGTLDDVSSLSGVLRTRGGELVAFSIIANGVRSIGAKRIEDRIGARLAALERSSTPPGPVDAGATGQGGEDGP